MSELWGDKPDPWPEPLWESLVNWLADRALDLVPWVPFAVVMVAGGLFYWAVLAVLTHAWGR